MFFVDYVTLKKWSKLIFHLHGVIIMALLLQYYFLNANKESKIVTETRMDRYPQRVQNQLPPVRSKK